jgi:hypothetical protein
MKLKSLIFGLCVALCSSVCSANQHRHPQTNMNANEKASATNLSYPGYCEIEVINNSFEDVRVYGVFDDGASLLPFNVYSFESPHYISLYYYGYCHSGMDIFIDTLSGYHLYAGYTERRSTIRIVPYLAHQLKAEISVK